MEDFFECPAVWLFSACVLVLVVLAKCEEREPYDPYSWNGARPDEAEVACYEREMVENSLPPCGE